MPVVSGAPLIGIVVLGAALLLAGWVLWASGVRLAQVRAGLDDRFIAGVPWGTIVVLAWLLFVYLFIQRGLWDWNRPLMLPFMAFSIFEPVGWLLGGFAHSSPGHLRSNLTTTLVFAPIVEYIWGHYPRSEPRRREPAWARIPAVRAFVLFPLGIVLVGILITLFSWGPVIGFSIVAFALIGCAVVHYPLLTLLALIARHGIRVGIDAFRHPITITEATVRVVRPGWYGVAVQGHLLGLLTGVLVGLWLIHYHRREPDPLRLWIGSVLVGLYLSIWALWWVLGPEEFVVFRAAGVALVLLVASAITLVAVTHSPSRDVRLPRGIARAALAVFIVAVLGMGAVGIGLNLAVVESPEDPPARTIDGYDIHYGERVPDGMMNLVDLRAIGVSTEVRTSGVIVVNQERNIWHRIVPARDLETRGASRFHVGGLTWSEEVIAVRRGWVPAGNDSVYQVWVGQLGDFTPAFASEPSRADLRVENHEFTLLVDDGVFSVAVTHDGAVTIVPIPADGNVTTVFDVEIVRSDEILIARTNGTEVPIAVREEYE